MERPNRKVYAITEDGVQALKVWLAKSRPLSAERFPFLVQLYFARHLAKDELLSVLTDQRRQHWQKLTAFRQIELPQADTQAMAQQIIFGGFTLDFGIRYEEMIIAWLDKVISEVEERIIE